jgi:VanZ family protein
MTFAARHLLPPLAVSVTAATLVLLLMPARYVPAATISHQDKLEHLALFALLAALWRAAGTPIAATIASAIALAVASELAQAAMAIGRVGDIDDAIADLAGTLLGVAAWGAASAWWSSRSRRA